MLRTTRVACLRRQEQSWNSKIRTTNAFLGQESPKNANLLLHRRLHGGNHMRTQLRIFWFVFLFLGISVCVSRLHIHLVTNYVEPLYYVYLPEGLPTLQVGAKTQIL